MDYTYSIVYASDFQPIAQDGSNNFDHETIAHIRRDNMDNSDELEVVRVDPNGHICYRDGIKWIKVS